MLGLLYQLSRDLLGSRYHKYRRYFIRETELSHRLNLIIGARGVGKTTTLVQHLLDYVKGDVASQKILYVQSDHFLVSPYTLYDIAEQFVLYGGEYLAIDEIHKYPNWSQELKSIYDTFPKLNVTASGSSALEIHKGSHDLSRRALVYTMHGLSLREYTELRTGLTLPVCSFQDLLASPELYAAPILDALASKELRILPLFQDYLRSGYYPYVREFRTEQQFLMALQQNVQVAIESDLVAIHPDLSGRALFKLRQLLAFLASSVPFSPNWQKLKSIIEVGDSRTLKNYFRYLEDAGLVRTLYRASHKMKRLESGEKVYLNNPNLLHMLAPEGPNIGTLRETFLLSMLQKDHAVTYPKQGDFMVDDRVTLEVGGPKKSATQLDGVDHAFIAADGIEHPGLVLAGKKSMPRIPLWLFGFLY